MPPNITRGWLTSFFVGADGRVSGYQKNIFAQPHQRRGQRIVVQATAAIHSARPCRKINDFHVVRGANKAPDAMTLFARSMANYSDEASGVTISSNSTAGSSLHMINAVRP